MAYPSVYPTHTVASIPTFGMPGHTYIAASGPVVPRPAPPAQVVAPHPMLVPARVHPTGVAAERRVQRLALALLLTVVLLGMPLAVVLATAATH